MGPRLSATCPLTCRALGFTVIGKPYHDIQKPALSRRVPVGDGSLHQMSRAVELVIPAQVGPAMFKMKLLEVAVEVAILHLGLLDIPDRTVYLALEIRIRVGGERVGRGFDPLGRIAVPGDVLHLAALLPFQPQRIQPARCAALLILNR